MKVILTTNIKNWIAAQKVLGFSRRYFLVLFEEGLGECRVTIVLDNGSQLYAENAEF